MPLVSHLIVNASACQTNSLLKGLKYSSTKPLYTVQILNYGDTSSKLEKLQTTKSERIARLVRI